MSRDIEPHTRALPAPETPEERRERLRYRYDWGLPTGRYDLAEERLFIQETPITEWTWEYGSKLARVQAGLTQAEMGDLVGVSSLTICRWELGTRQPYQAELRWYVAELGRLRQETLEYLDGLDLPEFDPEDAWWRRDR